MQVVSEWGQAKAEAAQAKAAGDKNKQKGIGLIIRSLKLEMKELGACCDHVLVWKLFACCLPMLVATWQETGLIDEIAKGRPLRPNLTQVYTGRLADGIAAPASASCISYNSQCVDWQVTPATFSYSAV